MELQASSLDSNWFTGLNNLATTAFPDNPTGLRRFLWLYFQKVYNSTYNNFTLY